ncbi:5'-3' exoribonuclease 1-like [Mya arenaria]|uniref:5'-3' exoribonuclease 1-like n=1 Tax=Mya arenaria TaxID=6604 RepID=UPI0022E41DD1|nr:5'-3' exoribonuclease 1-like [Mya arenaria]
MGVPKFYRWISERFPCLSEVVKEFQIPEFDNLYLDMNGIVHVCSHPEDDNPHFRITEEKIFSDIMYYLEFLFRMIKPQKVFFMAVDGVAPRAKMNQQRGRRFRSAREAEELERRAREKGEVLPTEKRFDSNCITPGTPFMVRLQEQLKYFVVKKVSQDPLWKGVRVYLSGHETPGEGEHKIMDFIRAERADPNYDPNTRHCLYGLDADLMMLGLATHEPHFSLLREEVRFGGKSKQRSSKRPQTPEETTFHLLHLSLFREYLDFEFSDLKGRLKDFEYNLENVIDDWVLMGFLVGNDFIPHLPNLHINHDALPLLWRTYIAVLPECGGYINNGGNLNLERFEKYLKELSKFDFETFSEQAGDLKWFQGKKAGASAEQSEVLSAARKLGKNQQKSVERLHAGNQFALLDTLNGEEVEDEELGTELIPRLDDYSEDQDTEDYSEEDTLDDEFRHHKRHYYMTKLEYETVTPEVLRDQAEGYVRGIQWILLYYYQGVQSWSWFYPHHYAPYMSDVKDFVNMDLTFDIGTPFMPFEQLMAVLPAASKELLPVPYQNLMTNATSPVIEFYPLDFETDLNGKQQDWEAVVLIPFIDERRLLEAIRSVCHLLTPDEKARNSHGPHLLYEYVEEPGEPYPSILPEAFPDIAVNHARLTKVQQDDHHIDPARLKMGILPGARLDVFFPGFPTLRHIPHRAELSKEGVKVFQANSRGFNTMLHIKASESVPSIDQIAQEYLGREIYVSWPHLYEAKVVAVCDDKYCFSQVKDGAKGSKPTIRRDTSDDNMTNIWYKEKDTIAERYHDRLGVVIGQTHILLRALPMTGRKYILGSHGRITMEKQFGVHPVAFALQATVKDIAVHEPGFCQFTTLSEYMPEKAEVFMLGWPHYGCQGEVLDTDMQSGRVRINLSILEEPSLAHIVNNMKDFDIQYVPGFVGAQNLGISGHLLSRLTGTIVVTAGCEEVVSEQMNPHRVNVGLNLKFTKRQEEVPGYTRLQDGQWAYSFKCVDTLRDYMKKFPDMFDIISKSDRKHNDMFYENEVIPENSGYNLKNVQEYVKGLECTNVKTQKAGADIMAEGVIKALLEETDKTVEVNKKRQKRVKMQVKPHLLYRPIVTSGSLIPDSSTEYQLFDRVVNTRQGFSVPFGLRGTIVGIHPAEVEVNTVYEVIFDEDFAGGISIRNSTSRGYRMPPSALLNLTHGERKNGARPSTGVKMPAEQMQGQTHRQNQARNVSSDFTYTDAWGGKSGVNRCNQGQGHQRNQGYHDNRAGNNSGQRGHQTSNTEYDRQNRSGYHQQQGQQQGQQYGRQLETRDSKAHQSGVFNGGNVSPKFVTPRLSQGGAQGGGHGGGVQGVRQTQAANTQKQNQNNSAANTEFESMWKQLQSSLPPEGSETDKQGTSLSHAAAVLPTVPSPVPQNMGGQSPEPGTKIDVQSLFSQASRSDRPVSVGDLENIEEPPKDKATKPRPLASRVVSNDEFSAMFKSLEEVHVSEEKQDVEAKDEDGSLAIKKLLHIAESPKTESDEATPPGGEGGNAGKSSYGRQLSVQELFDVAKHQAPGAEHQQQQSYQQQQQNQYQQQQHQQQQRKGRGRAQPRQQDAGIQQQGYQGNRNNRPVLLNPPPRGGNRNPVMELMTFCQSLQMGLPMYDYIPKNGVYFCVVTLFNGARFQGALCKTKEEAAESAASVALLQLRGSMQQMASYQMMSGFLPPGARPPGRQFPSPNSAFSPVSNPPGFFQGQGPPHPGHQQRPHPGQWYQQNGGKPGNQQGYPATNQQPPFSQNQSHSGSANQTKDFSRSDKPLAGASTNQNQPGKTKPTSVVTPFVPLQVTRKQTPQKNRKGSASDESSSKLEEEKIAKEDKPSVLDSSNKDSKVSDSTPENVSQNLAGGSAHGKVDSSKGGPKSPPKTPKEKTTPPRTTGSSSKKPKRRLAANFGNMQ